MPRVIVVQRLKEGERGDALGLRRKRRVPQIGGACLTEDQSPIPRTDLVHRAALPTHGAADQRILCILRQRGKIAARTLLRRICRSSRNVVVHSRTPFKHMFLLKGV